MVDNILNDKDNSRLSLFEEAAGISKFRKRKKETFNKIKQTESDLDRVEDLVYEIEKNLRSLKESGGWGNPGWLKQKVVEPLTHSRMAF